MQNRAEVLTLLEEMEKHLAGDKMLGSLALYSIRPEIRKRIKEIKVLVENQVVDKEVTDLRTIVFRMKQYCKKKNIDEEQFKKGIG